MNRIMALILIIIFSPIMLFLSALIIFSDGFPVLYRQQRPGRENVLFTFYKFRSMKKDTPEVATHLLSESETHLLKLGKYMRKLSLDELPNLINVMKGDMVFVGPRPALYNQYDLIEMRTNMGIHKLKPGVTGWAQVNGRDELTLTDKVNYDKYYLDNRSILLSIKILFITIRNVLGMRGVSH